MELEYETLLCLIFGLDMTLQGPQFPQDHVAGRVLERWGDPARLADTDIWHSQPAAKIGLGYAAALYESFANRFGINFDSDEMLSAIDQAESANELGEVLHTLNASFRGTFDIRNGVISFR